MPRLPRLVPPLSLHPVSSIPPASQQSSGRAAWAGSNSSKHAASMGRVSEGLSRNQRENMKANKVETKPCLHHHPASPLTHELGMDGMKQAAGRHLPGDPLENRLAHKDDLASPGRARAPRTFYGHRKASSLPPQSPSGSLSLTSWLEGFWPPHSEIPGCLPPWSPVAGAVLDTMPGPQLGRAGGEAVGKGRALGLLHVHTHTHTACKDLKPLSSL